MPPLPKPRPVLAYRSPGTMPRPSLRSFVFAVVANTFTAVAGLYLGGMIYDALTWQGGGNWAAFGAMVLGVPTVLLQLVFTPLSLSLAADGRREGWRRWMVRLVALTAPAGIVVEILAVVLSLLMR